MKLQRVLNGGVSSGLPAVRDAPSVQARSPTRIPGGRLFWRIAFGIVGETKPRLGDVEKHGALSGGAHRLRDLHAFLGALSVIGGHWHVCFLPDTTNVASRRQVFNSEDKINNH